MEFLLIVAVVVVAPMVGASTFVYLDYLRSRSDTHA